MDPNSVWILVFPDPVSAANLFIAEFNTLRTTDSSMDNSFAIDSQKSISLLWGEAGELPEPSMDLTLGSCLGVNAGS